MKKWQIFIVGFLIGGFAGAGGLFTWAALKLKSKNNPATVAGKMSSVPGGTTASVPQGDPDIAQLLSPIRRKYQLPALGGAIVTSAGVRVMAVDGVRKQGSAVDVTVDDVWHLGSDTKAMTATMIAVLVEQGKLSWDSTLGGIFPDLKLPAQVKGITLLQLLVHRAGLPANADWYALSKSGSLVEQRRAAVALLNSTELLSNPGVKFNYSNWGYVICAAMAEQVTGKSYEDLMQTLLFKPLDMHSTGYGAMGTPGKLDEPWGHTPDGVPVQSDNPLVMAPAGGLYCSLDDWGKFITDQLKGSEGKSALLKPDSYSRLHTAPFGGTYAMGWGLLDRPWGGGQVLMHSGSNTFNVAVVWMAPARDFALLIVCNQTGTEKACDDVSTGLYGIWKKTNNAP
jgi:CubicO group peptidase (beta-lactamase class C family)